MHFVINSRNGEHKQTIQRIFLPFLHIPGNCEEEERMKDEG